MISRLALVPGTLDSATIASIARSVRGDRVDGLSARDGADIAADAVRQIGERVQLDDLAGELLDGADAVGKIVACMGRLSDHVEAHEFAALASGDHAAPRAAG